MAAGDGRFLTLFAQVFQALSMIALTLGLAHQLGPADVVRYSLTVATAQFLAVLGFEWLRLAAWRHYPGPPQETAARLAGLRVLALLILGGMALALLLVWGSAGAFLRAAGLVAGFLIAIALLQGLSDLQLTLLRLDGGLRTSARCQILRSCALCGGTWLSTLIWGGAQAALAGLTLGYLVSGLIALALHRPHRAGPFWACQPDFTRRVLRYGLTTASASQAHSALSWLIRFAATAALGPTTPAAAGFTIAFDILARPFAFVGTFLTTVFMPGLIKTYEARHHSRAALDAFRHRLRQHYALFLGLPALIGVALWVALPDVAQALLPEGLSAGFTAARLPLLFWFGLLFTLQTTVAIEPQLHTRTGISLILALLHLGFGVLILATASALDWLAPTAQGLHLSRVLTLLNALTGALIVAGGLWVIGAWPNLRQIWPCAVAALLVLACNALPDSATTTVLRPVLAALIAALYALYALKAAPPTETSS